MAPTPALDAGADLVAQSCHKTLGSLVGTAQVHVGRNSPVSPEQVRDALNFLQTTSPNYLQLASLDANRRWLAREGAALFGDAVDEAAALADEVDRLPGLKVLRTADDPRLADHAQDPLRLVINVAGAGWTGYDAELLLRERVSRRGRDVRLVQRGASDQPPRRTGGAPAAACRIETGERQPPAAAAVGDRRSRRGCCNPRSRRWR